MNKEMSYEISIRRATLADSQFDDEGRPFPLLHMRMLPTG